MLRTLRYCFGKESYCEVARGMRSSKSCAQVFERAQQLDALECAAKLEPNDMESSEIEPPDLQYDMLAIIAADEPSAGGKKKRGSKLSYASL